MKRPAMLQRFPKLRSSNLQSWPIAEADAPEKYPELADDIALAEEYVGGVFAVSDSKALRKQNQYRLQQVVIIVGSAFLSGLGGLQAALPDQRWPGISLTVLGLFLGLVGRAERELGAYGDFLDERVKAERLRSTYFRFLSRTGGYEKDDQAVRLRRVVSSIEAGEEPQ